MYDFNFGSSVGRGVGQRLSYRKSTEILGKLNELHCYISYIGRENGRMQLKAGEEKEAEERYFKELSSHSSALPALSCEARSSPPCVFSFRYHEDFQQARELHFALCR